MTKSSFLRVVVGMAVLVASCGGGGGQSGTAGNNGGQAGSGAGGRAGSGAGQAGNAAGGSGGGGSCVPTSACGGNLVGTWTATQSCITATEDLSSVCPGATTEISFAVGGTVTFDANGSYKSVPTAGSVTYHEHFPPGCMPYGQTCEELGQTLSNPDAGTSGTCSTDSAGACTCDATGPETATGEAGTYVTSGGTLTLTHDGTTSTTQYCVQNGLLYEILGPTDGGVSWLGGVVWAKP